MLLHDPDKGAQVWGARKCGARQRITLRSDYIAASIESVPFANNNVDTVLVTFSLCTIPDVVSALASMRRVLLEQMK